MQDPVAESFSLLCPLILRLNLHTITCYPPLLHVCCEDRSGLWRQSFPCKARDLSILPSVSSFQVVAHPLLHVRHFRPLVSGRPLDGGELREADTKAHIIRILFCYRVVRGSKYGWIFQKLEQSLARVCPALLVLLCERSRVRKRFGQRYDGGLSIQWSQKLLCVRKDDVKVKWNEDTMATQSASCRS